MYVTRAGVRALNGLQSRTDASPTMIRMSALQMCEIGMGAKALPSGELETKINGSHGVLMRSACTLRARQQLLHAPAANQGVFSVVNCRPQAASAGVALD